MGESGRREKEEGRREKGKRKRQKGEGDIRREDDIDCAHVSIAGNLFHEIPTTAQLIQKGRRKGTKNNKKWEET